MKTEINKLIEEADHYQDEHPRKTEILQKAYALAQNLKDIELQLEVGTSLVGASQWSGNKTITLSIFPQLLNLLDENPEYLDEYSLLWEYKWVVRGLPDYPNITKIQIFDALKDMEQRFISEGNSKKVIYQYMSKIYLKLGMLEEAKVFYGRSKKHKGDAYLSDCTACIVNAKVLLYCLTESLEEALVVAKPIFNKKYSCHSVPISTYAYVLPFVMKAGQMEKAKEMFDRFCKVYSKDSELYSGPIFYCIKTEQYSKAINFLEKASSRFLDPRSTDYKPIKSLDDFNYALSFWYLCDSLDQGKKKEVKIRFHKDFVHFKSNHNYTIEELKNFFKTEALTLAMAFDLRNENNFISNQITEVFNY